MRFPFDPALPQLQTLVNPQEMQRINEGALDLQIASCSPKYVRYKPETSCIIQYELSYVTNDGETVAIGAHIKVYADHRAEAKASGGRASRLDKRLETLQPAVQKVRYLPEVDGALQIYPADLDLRDLARVADINSAGKEIKKALNLPRSPKMTAEPELVRYKPGRKALFRYHVPTVSDLPLYGKVFADQSVSDMRDIANNLIESGLPTARVLGIIDDRNFIVHETVPGVALKEMRNLPEYVQWIEPLAKRLWQLQSIDFPQLANHTLDDEVATLREVQNQLSVLLPDLAPRLATIVESIEKGFKKIDDALVTSHGDFYDDQAIVGGEELAIIDLEAMRRSHPLLDVGNMLAHLTSATKSEEANVAIAHRKFLQLAMEHTEENESTIHMFEAACLLKLAPGPFRRLEESWETGVERLLALAESRLKPGLADDALPQLETILDTSVMKQKLTSHLGDQEPPLKSVELIRHKQGRRAIFRFELEDSSSLYGKTFASKRGPRVFAITKSITEASAFGKDVWTPEAVAYLEDEKLVLLRGMLAEPIEDRLIQGDTDLAERISFALYHLHSSNVELGRWHDLEKELSPLSGRCAEVGEYAPELGSDAERLLQEVLGFDHRDICWRFRPIHRDMYHDQILSSKEELAILDLDDASMSEPTVDVANFATHLLLLGLQREHDAEAYRGVIDSFLNQYIELDSDMDPVLLNYLIATTSLRLAGIHVSRENGPIIAKGMLTIGQIHLQKAESMQSVYS